MDTNTNTTASNGFNSHTGVRRSRDTDVSSSNSSKRRKFDSRVKQNALVIQLQNDSEDNVSSAESGDHAVTVTSPCFKHDLNLDLKSELRFVTETSMSSNYGFSRETSSSSEICLNSDEMESSSTLKPNPPSRKQPNNPTAAEIEAFFAVMESKEHKRFADKYNYDIVNDVPMDGRYQWVLLKP
ncbi:cyclin-dependent kinase inhibitor 7-like [Bidens hawaiensis]|uniref:cyclin-dependent kinase inhibitor 7-like n=1 Tax=Bidens hawaiensis TaxID=980011 RepID=UPI004049DC89